MEYIIEKSNKTKKLTPEDKLHLAKRIVNDFKTYDDARSSILSFANELISEIFFKKNLSKENDKNKTWKAKVKCVSSSCFIRHLKLLFGRIHIPALIQCLMFLENL